MKKMKLYETKNYIVIIYYVDFTERVRRVTKEDLETFIKKLNESDAVFDYEITKELDIEYE